VPVLTGLAAGTRVVVDGAMLLQGQLPPVAAPERRAQIAEELSVSRAL
jgi:hypothetical protein